MPSHLKAMLSGLVAVVAIAIFFWEHASEGGAPAWLILALGAFMIVSMWVFPEAGASRRGDKDKAGD
jgi:hypothetical protein